VDLSCIGALVCNGGRLLMQVRDRAFLRHLLRQFAGCLLVIWDGPPIHRCKMVQRFLECRGRVSCPPTRRS